MIRQEEPKPNWTSKRAHDFEVQTMYGALKLIGNADPVSEVVKSCGFEDGAVAYAKRFWHDVFQDLPELRSHFPAHAERFGPYTA